MKVIHCLGWYLPESVGGTELYVRGLANHLTRLGVACVVMAPTDGAHERRYMLDGIQVLRFPIDTGHFEAQLDETNADIFHLHSQTRGSGALQLATASKRGLRCFTTIHVPGALCARGTLMRMGTEPCDGRIDARQCAPCWLQFRGIPASVARPVAAVARHIPAPIVGATSGRLKTLLRADGVAADLRSRLLDLADHSERIIAVAHWLLEALRRNGIGDDKLLLCRQGVEMPALPEVPRGTGPMRVGFFGRLDPVKGLDVLVEGFLRAGASVPLELHVHTAPPAALHRSYAANLESAMSNDSRIVQHGPAEPDQVQTIMHRYDAIAVPSQWLETGPLVAKEALAVGTPVIGSRLGGIAELIEDGVNGLLVEAPEPDAWARALDHIVRRPLGRVRTPPSSELVPEVSATASSMLDLYSAVLQSTRH